MGQHLPDRDEAAMSPFRSAIAGFLPASMNQSLASARLSAAIQYSSKRTEIAAVGAIRLNP